MCKKNTLSLEKKNKGKNKQSWILFNFTTFAQGNYSVLLRPIAANIGWILLVNWTKSAFPKVNIKLKPFSKNKNKYKKKRGSENER